MIYSPVYNIFVFFIKSDRSQSWNMADVDSLHDIESSDLDADPSAVEADAESDEQTEERFKTQKLNSCSVSW